MYLAKKNGTFRAVWLLERTLITGAGKGYRLNDASSGGNSDPAGFVLGHEVPQHGFSRIRGGRPFANHLKRQGRGCRLEVNEGASGCCIDVLFSRSKLQEKVLIGCAIGSRHGSASRNLLELHLNACAVVAIHRADGFLTVFYPQESNKMQKVQVRECGR